MTMSGNSLKFVITPGHLDGVTITTPSAKVYFNGEHVATVGTGVVKLYNRDPNFDDGFPCPTLSVAPLFVTVEVEIAD